MDFAYCYYQAKVYELIPLCLDAQKSLSKQNAKDVQGLVDTVRSR